MNIADTTVEAAVKTPQTWFDKTIIVILVILGILIALLIIYAIISVSDAFNDLYDKQSKEATSKSIFNKYYKAQFDYDRCLQYLDKYDNVMNTFEMIYVIYIHGTNGSCCHGKLYAGCTKCYKFNKTSFLINTGGYNITSCAWLRSYIGMNDDGKYSVPYVNTVVENITSDMSNTIYHHHQIKPIVDRLRAFYNKYDSQLQNDSTYMKYRPYIIRYFEQYDADAVNVADMAQAKLTIAQVAADYEKDKKE